MKNPKEGALVILKSGGPVMVAEADQGGTVISCVWFDGEKCVRDGFHVDALIEIDKDEKRKL